MLNLPGYVQAALSAQDPVLLYPRVQWSPDWTTWYPLRPISGSHTQDRGQQTRWSFSGKFQRDYQVGSAPGQIHPYGCRAKIDIGIKTLRNGTFWVPAGRYMITQAARSDDQLSIDLQGQSYETEVIDTGFVKARNLPDKAKMDYRRQTEVLITEAVPDAQFYWDPSLVTNYTIPKQTLDTSSGRWDWIDGTNQSYSVMGAIGAEASCNAAGYFQFLPVPTLDRAPVGSVPRNGAQVQPSVQLDRDQVYNLVIATGDSTDGNTSIGPAYAWDDDPSSLTYAGPDPLRKPGSGTGRYGLKPIAYSNSLIKNNDQAGRAAAALLANYLGAHYSVQVSTRFTPAWEVGDVISFERDPGWWERHVLDSITYNWGDAVGQVLTRTPKAQA